jgi:hypothetical protein
MIRSRRRGQWFRPDGSERMLKEITFTSGSERCGRLACYRWRNEARCWQRDIHGFPQIRSPTSKWSRWREDARFDRQLTANDRDKNKSNADESNRDRDEFGDRVMCRVIGRQLPIRVLQPKTVAEKGGDAEAHQGHPEKE